MSVRSVAILVVLVLSSMVVRADSLPVANGSFENPAIPNAFPFVGTPDAWDMDGFFLGSFLNITGIANVDGNQLGYILSSGQFGEAFSQTLSGHTYQAGKEYTLSAGICLSNSMPLATDRISLGFFYYDNALVPHLVGAPLDVYNDAAAGLTTTSMKQFSVGSGFINDPAVIGREIGIRIWTSGTPVADILTNPQNGRYFDVDNVTVVVPEPATLGVFALAGLALMLRRRV